jgi:hypothetical protein
VLGTDPLAAAVAAWAVADAAPEGEVVPNFAAEWSRGQTRCVPEPAFAKAAWEQLVGWAWSVESSVRARFPLAANNCPNWERSNRRTDFAARDTRVSGKTVGPKRMSEAQQRTSPPRATARRANSIVCVYHTHVS